jgi:hypothetical protein
MQQSECLLATLPGSNPGDRLLLVLAQSRAGESQVVLRQQSWAAGIGWYDQKSLALAPHQLRELKAVLGCRRSSPQPDDPDVSAILPFPGVACNESA